MLISVFSYSTFISTDQQPSSLDACAQLSAEEKLVAEQSLSVFCKPVEFYNILHHRTTISSVSSISSNWLKLSIIVNYNFSFISWDKLHELQSWFCYW